MNELTELEKLLADKEEFDWNKTFADRLVGLQYRKNPLLALISKSANAFSGKYIPVPLIYNEPHKLTELEKLLADPPLSYSNEIGTIVTYRGKPPSYIP